MAPGRKQSHRLKLLRTVSRGLGAGNGAGLLRASAGVAAVYLFGSRGRGDAQPNSDVDVAVLFQEDPPSTFEGLPLDLESELPATDISICFLTLLRYRRLAGQRP